MTNCVKNDARKRMARLLTSDAARYRLSRLPVDAGEFAADVMEAYAAGDAVSSLDETEVLAVCELAAKMGLRFAPGGDAALSARKGRAVMVMGFAAMYAVCKRLTG